MTLPLTTLTTLNRQQLGEVFKDPRTLLAFERIQLYVATIIPETFTAFQNLDFVVTVADPTVPNAHVITAGANMSVTPATGLVTLKATPTGASGQIQYNNAGTFGAFTTSGDATINTATGVLTLATVNANVGTFASPNLDIDAKGRIIGVTAAAWGVTFSCQDISTKPLNTVIGRVPIPFAWTLPATTSSPAGYAVGEVTGAPSAQTDFLLLNDGVSVATLRFASSGHSPTLIKAADTAFVQGDYVDLQTPSNLNGMSGAFGIAAIGVR